MASPRREVDFPLAGYASPGFHTWPGSADVLVGEYETGDSHPKKKTFGETFGAATGVSDPRLQKMRIRNNGAGGEAATVAGYAGPGLHTWPGSADVLVGEYESASSHPVPCQKDVTRPAAMRRSFRTRVSFSG